MGKWITKAKQYRIDNEKFLEAKAREEGIVALESGILMRQIEKGSGETRPGSVTLSSDGRLRF